MTTLIFPTQNLKPEQLKDDQGKVIELSKPCSVLAANTPYCISPNPRDFSIQSTLSGLNTVERDKLMCSMDIFDQQLLAIADLYDRAIATLDLQATGSLVGAGATASHARLTGFQKAILDYQNALTALSENSQAKQTGRPEAARKAQLKNAVERAYAHLQKTYQTELKKIVSQAEWGKNRGSALSSAQRGINVATHRKYRQLNIQNGKQATQLAKLTKGINYAGNGLIVLDAGIRANKVRNAYRDKKDWQRELAVQATGFGLGGAMGLTAGNAAIGALTAIGLGLTPIGWVIMIGAAVTVGYYTAKHMDNIGQSAAGYIYDRNLIGNL